MNCSIKYERLDPDTVHGHMIRVIHLYSSFNKEDMDILEDELEKSIGAGIGGELESRWNGKQPEESANAG